MTGGTADGLLIRLANGAADMARVRRLFLDYQAWLGVDLCFQGFAEEVNTLPGRYAPPGGCLLLAEDGGALAGGVGMWALGDNGVCEMKRLFVYDKWRRRGVGGRLAKAVIGTARDAGYSRMRLDTLSFMDGARALYRALGFRQIAPYYDNPLDGMLYLEKDLSAGPAGDG